MQSQLLINGALVEGKGERLPVYNPRRARCCWR